MYYPQPLTISNLQPFNSIDARSPIVVLRYDHTGASDPTIFKHSYGNTCDSAVSGNSNVDTRDPADGTKWHYVTENLDRGPRHRRNAKPDQLNDVDTDQYCLATDQCDPVGLYSPDRSPATRCYRCARSIVTFVTACTAGWYDPTILPADSTALRNTTADRKTVTARSGRSQVPSGQERPSNPCCTRQRHNRWTGNYSAKHKANQVYDRGKSIDAKFPHHAALQRDIAENQPKSNTARLQDATDSYKQKGQWKRLSAGSCMNIAILHSDKGCGYCG